MSAAPLTDEPDVPWGRLSLRVVYLNLAQVAVSLVTGFLAAVVLDSGPVRPLLIAAGFGVLGAAAELVRWGTTRFRVTDERVELRTGWLARRHRTVPRDRIRSVDSRAKLRQRLAGVRVVHIGSGETESSFDLNALTAEDTRRLQRELMPGGHQPAPAADAAPASEEAPAGQPVETVIARFRWQWVALSAASLWAPLVVAVPVFSAYWFLRPLGVDLLAAGGTLLDWEGRGVVRAVLICLAVAVPVGVATLAAGFAVEYGRFALVRVGTPPATALLTRRGLLSTRTVHRDDSRIRGLAWSEPLLWRWLHLTETQLVTTGGGQESESGKILPRTTMAEARALAGDVLPDGLRPLDAPLRRHPRGALTRRLLIAAYVPVGAAAVLAVFAATGALPGGLWPIPLALLPVTLPVAVLAYRSLGHALDGPYLVMRRGAVNRRTVALQRRAVIGWTVRQSLFQRWGGRATVGVATAAGSRFYEIPDAGLDQALSLIQRADPELAGRFLTAAPSGSDREGAPGQLVR